jgi:predicted ArsR family transcriptional regulator
VISDDDLEVLGVFAEPQRRRVYEQLQHEGAATVSELVQALGMGRTLVAFHLGKLLEVGFVEVVAPEQVAGVPGRPAQRYRATRREVVATVPDRRYDLIAAILLDSLADQRPGESAQASAERTARRRGTELARAWRNGSAPRNLEGRLARLVRLLRSLGYAPRSQGAELLLRNCPFNAFRATNTPQVCPLNQALADGYLHGLELDAQLQATLRPSPDVCCVVFGPRTAPSS